MALIDYIDPVNRRIHLSIETMNAAWHPVELYREIRFMRRTDESLRPYNNFMRADGNIDKGGGKATERYFTLLEGARLFPYDASHIIDITGTLITDDGLEGAFCIDKSLLSPGVTTDIQYSPKQVEVINLNFDDLVYSSFQGAVWIDTTSPYGDKGTDIAPNGNTERPVNSTALAVEIAADRGFRKLQIIGNLVLGTGDDVRGFDMQGTSHVNSVLVVNPGALCLKTIFRSFNISGVLDGDSDVFDCVVGDLEYFDGHIHDSSLSGTITLSGQKNATIKNCASLDITVPPIINGNSSLQSLSMPNYSGPIIFENITEPTVQMGIGLDAGRVYVNSSCTAGTIGVSGVGELFDNSGINCYVVGNLLNGTNIANLQRTVEYLRPHHTNSGDVYYWNPYDGNDAWDGKEVTRAFKTFAAAHDACGNANHDVIMCVSGDPAGLTVSNEVITISKDYLFLRGPGRDFNIVSADGLQDMITITGRGVEVSGLRVSTGLTSTKAAISSTGVFTLIKNVYIYESYNGVIFKDGEYCIADNVKLHHGTGTGLQILGTSDHTDVVDCHIGSNALDGVSIDILGGHEVNFLGNNIIHKNVGAGIRISATTEAIILTTGTEVFFNGTDILDEGIDTYKAIDPTTTATAVWADQSAISLAEDVSFLKSIEGGRWLIDETTSQMVFFGEDNSTEVARFALKGRTGEANHTEVFDRVRL